MNNFKEIEQLFQTGGLKPNKLLGQNFLVDKKILEKILAAADLSKNDTVLEVGPGLGILTAALAERAGYIMTVEKDKRLTEILKEKFKNTKNLEIIQGDVMKLSHLLTPSPPVGKGRLSGDGPEISTPYKLIANIPYYLTARLIRTFLESANPPQQMILMIQKEVAERICAKPPKMSLLAVSVQFYAIAEICAIVPRQAFWPQPKVDSAIIRITPRSQNLFPERSAEGAKSKGLPASAFDSSRQYVGTLLGNKYTSAFRMQFFRIVKAGFSQPRKQLINNLSRGLKTERFQITQVLKKIGLAPQQRAETLSLVDWLKLTKFL